MLTKVNVLIAERHVVYAMIFGIFKGIMQWRWYRALTKKGVHTLDEARIKVTLYFYFNINHSSDFRLLVSWEHKTIYDLNIAWNNCTVTCESSQCLKQFYELFSLIKSVLLGPVASIPFSTVQYLFGQFSMMLKCTNKL